MSLPAKDSADPEHKQNVAKRFIKAAALCMSCCRSTQSIIFKASAKISPSSLHTTKMDNHVTLPKMMQSKINRTNIQLWYSKRRSKSTNLSSSQKGWCGKKKEGGKFRLPITINWNILPLVHIKWMLGYGTPLEKNN